MENFEQEETWIRIDVKNNRTKEKKKEGEAIKKKILFPAWQLRLVVAFREKEREKMGVWSRVTRSLLECLRRRLITQLRGFSRMLISRNTCKTRREISPPPPFPLCSTPIRAPVSLSRIRWCLKQAGTRASIALDG